MLEMDVSDKQVSPSSSPDAEGLPSSLHEHPCFSAGCQRSNARMHIAVAPRCNISCNYCVRKFDCVNESRPGVSSTVLDPEEALVRFKVTRSHVDNLKVVGIAGPGDALANWTNVKKTFSLIRAEDPRVTFCLSTNGLLLPRYADEIARVGVSHATVTINAVDPTIGARIYDHVVLDGVAYTGEAAARTLLENQIRGIELLVSHRICIKVNTVLIPGINDAHVEDIARLAARLGATCQNVTPLIPVPGSKFEDIPAAAPAMVDQARAVCAPHLRQIYHCRQCRADAIGLLGSDISQTIDRLCRTSNPTMRIAVASRQGTQVDTHFGHAEKFFVFDVHDTTITLRESREVTPYCERSRTCGYQESEGDRNDVFSVLKDCRAIICTLVGPEPGRILAEQNIDVFDTSLPDDLAIRRACAHGSVDEAIKLAYTYLIRDPEE